MKWLIWLVLVDCASAVPAPNFRVRLEVFSLPAQVEMPSDDEAWTFVQEKVRSGAAERIDFVVSTLNQKQGSQLCSAVEAYTVEKTKRAEVQSEPFEPKTVSWPEKFTQFELGEKFEIEITKVEGTEVDLSVKLDWARFDQWSGRKSELPRNDDFGIVRFSKMQFESAITVEVDSPHLLGESDDFFKIRNQDYYLVVFLSLRHLPLHPPPR